MPLRTKTIRFDFEDLVRAHRVIMSPILAYQRRVFGTFAVILSVIVVLGYVRYGLPSTYREGMMLVYGGMAVAALYCLAQVAGTYSSRLLRRQLNSREMQKYREKGFYLEIEGGALRIVRETGESTLQLDEMTKFALPGGTVCLFHPGYNSFVLVGREHFAEEGEWQQFQSLLEHTPTLGRRKL